MLWSHSDAAGSGANPKELKVRGLSLGLFDRRCAFPSLRAPEPVWVCALTESPETGNS
jgi:hypothetical protein